MRPNLVLLTTVNWELGLEKVVLGVGKFINISCLVKPVEIYMHKIYNILVVA